MLIISRNEGQSICVDETQIHVLEIRGKRVKLGLVGPPAVAFVRGELDKRNRDSGLTSKPKAG